MTSADLKKAISILYDMELNNYYTNQAIKALNIRIDNLGYKSRRAKPALKKAELGVEAPGILAFIVGLIGGIYGIVEAVKSGAGFFLIILLPLSAVVHFGLFAIVGAVIGLIINIIIKHCKNSEFKQKHKKDLEEYEKFLVVDADRVRNELKQKEFLIAKRNLLIKRQSEAKRKLATFYSYAGIDGRFCNIIAMGYMNEFIKLGISNKLGGADGLYYLIMQELRWDQMQYTLDEISNKLDMVIDNQHRIYSDLKRMNSESNRMINRLISGVNNLNSNVNELKAIEQYNGDRIARELEFQNFMMYIR